MPLAAAPGKDKGKSTRRNASLSVKQSRPLALFQNPQMTR